jgi:hypothetical protein
MTFPRRKHEVVLTIDDIGTDINRCAGRKGYSAKGGRGAGSVNCIKDREKRYAAMGSQKIGTTYHLVLVKT